MSAVPQSAVPASSLIDRSAHALLLTLAMSVLLAPAAGLSWLAAGLGLVLAAWPLVLAEQALAARARKPLLSGMQVLTREADAARGWRVLSWSSLGASLLAMALVALAAGALATQSLQTLLAGHVALPAGADLWPVLTVLVLLSGLLRPLGRAPVLVWLLPALMLLALAFAGHLAGHALPVSSDLALSASLPASAGLLYGALVPAAGLGLHWQLAAAGGARPGLGQRIPVLVLAGLLFAALQMAGLAAALLGFIVCLLA
ncbi:MAG: hypothetical protein VW625_08820, partial [Perlucidibaca sp.]